MFPLPQFGGWFWLCRGTPVVLGRGRLSPGLWFPSLQVETLQEVLEKLGSRELPTVEKRLSWVPLVQLGWGVAQGGSDPPLQLDAAGGGVGVQRRGGRADGAVPQCEAGEPCAVRRGARFGKLCSCPRGTACNLFILKCS